MCRKGWLWRRKTGLEDIAIDFAVAGFGACFFWAALSGSFFGQQGIVDGWNPSL